MSTTNLNEHAALTEINTSGQPIRALAFTTNGERLVSGDKDGVRVWRMSDNQQVGAMKAKDVRCVAVSSNRRYIAAGKSWGEITVWDAQTFKEVFTHNEDGHTVTGVDFSPDSTRLVSASGSRAVSVWDVTNGERVIGPLDHPYWVVAAKFSPHGDKIATATYLRDLVRIYDLNDIKSPREFSAKVTPYYNTGLLWSKRDEFIFILSNNIIKQINVSSSTPTFTAVVSQWSITESNFPSIISPKIGDFIAFSSSCTVTRCDMLTGNQLPLIQLSQDAHCIAISSDGRVLASGGDGKIVIKALLPAARRSTVELGQGIAQAELIQNEKLKPGSKSLRSRHGQSGIMNITGSGSN